MFVGQARQVNAVTDIILFGCSILFAEKNITFDYFLIFSGMFRKTREAFIYSATKAKHHIDLIIINKFKKIIIVCSAISGITK